MAHVHVTESMYLAVAGLLAAQFRVHRMHDAASFIPAGDVIVATLGELRCLDTGPDGTAAARLVVVIPDLPGADLGRVVQSGIACGADAFVEQSRLAADLPTALAALGDGHAWVPPHLLGTILRGFARRRSEEDDVLHAVARLTPRERHVLGLIACGMSANQVARHLFVSLHTARTHIQRIVTKFGAHSRREVAAIASRHDLVARFGLDEADTGR